MTLATANDPIREIAEILRRHIDHDCLQKIANELLEVRGNKTFREIIGGLADELARKSQR
jgi:hypothetical protein